jgi:hypothetical protein
MILRILRFLAVLAVGLFALRAYAHKIECEKDVGLVQLDAHGDVVVGTDGLPVFTSDPSPLLGIQSYPAAIGWRVRLNNLATETSIVGSFEDPLLASSTAGLEVYGTIPEHGTAIPVGGSIEVVIVQRIRSEAECAGAAPGIVPLDSGPVCRDEENVAYVTTHADAGSCRAKILCLQAAPPEVVVPPPLDQPPPFQPL